MANTVLVLDDQESIRYDLKRFLEQRNYIVHTAEEIKSAIGIVWENKIDFALIDLKIDVKSAYGGITMIKELKRLQPKTKVIIVSAYELNNELEKELLGVKYFDFVSKGGKKNYIEAVIEMLQKAQNQPISKKCFVIMPFSATKKCKSHEWKDIFNSMIKPAVEKSGYKYECSKANLSIGNIITDILNNLYESDVVIADLTDRNPNVYYELGVRHALRDATILITQSIKDVPFDLHSYALIEYDWKTAEGKKNFSEAIKRTFQDIEKSGKNIASPVHDYLKHTF